MGRSVLAVVLGYIVSVILVMTTFMLVGQLTTSLISGENPNPALAMQIFIGVQFFSLIYAVIGGYIAARLVKHDKVRHGLYLGIVMLLIAGLTMFMQDTGMLPFWQILFYVLVIPATMLGARINAGPATVQKPKAVKATKATKVVKTKKNSKKKSSSKK